MQINRIMLLEEHSKRNLSVRPNPKLVFELNLSLARTEEKPWSYEFSYAITLSPNREEEQKLFEGGGTYALSLTDFIDNNNESKIEPQYAYRTIWPYIRGDIVDLFNKFGLSAASIPYAIPEGKPEHSEGISENDLEGSSI